jgi:hypothetical protein
MSTIPRFIVILIVGLWTAGCQTVREYNYLANETLDYRDKKITSIVTKKGDVVNYDIAGARYIVDVRDTTMERKVIGFNIENRPISMPIEQILEISCEARELDGGGTGLLVVTAAGVLLLAIAAFAVGSIVH